MCFMFPLYGVFTLAKAVTDILWLHVIVITSSILPVFLLNADKLLSS